jgi:hypothetical protein
MNVSPVKLDRIVEIRTMVYPLSSVRGPSCKAAQV